MSDDVKDIEAEIDALFFKTEDEKNKEASKQEVSLDINPYPRRGKKPGPKTKTGPKPNQVDVENKGIKNLTPSKIKQLAKSTVDKIVSSVRKEHRQKLKEEKELEKQKRKEQEEKSRLQGIDIDNAVRLQYELEQTKNSIAINLPPSPLEEKNTEERTETRGAKRIWTPQLKEEFEVYKRKEAAKRKQIDADILTAGESLMPYSAQNESEKNRLALAGFKQQKKLHKDYVEAKEENKIDLNKLNIVWKNNIPEHKHQYEARLFLNNEITAECKICSKQLIMPVYEWIHFRRTKNAIEE